MLFFAYFKFFVSKEQIIINFLGDTDVFFGIIVIIYFKLSNAMNFNILIFFGQTSVECFFNVLYWCIFISTKYIYQWDQHNFLHRMT